MPRVSAKEAAAGPAVVINTAPANSEAEQASPVEEKPEKLPTWFFDMINSLPSDQWGGTYDLLLFRQGHSKVPMNDGFKGFLENFRQPVTLQQIKQNYGGGKFRLVLQKNSKYTTSHDFEIEGTPIYDLSRERPGGAPTNNGSGQAPAGSNEALLKILEEQFRNLNQQIADMRNQNPAAGNDRGLDLMAKSAEQAIELITKQVPQANSKTSEMREMVAALKDMGLIGQPQQQQKTLMEQLGELITNPIIGPIIGKFITPANPVEQITQYAGLFDIMEKIRGPRAAAGETEPQDWQTALAQHAPQILEAIKDWSQNSVRAAAERRAAAEAQERAAQNLGNRNAGARQAPQQPAAIPTPTNRPTVVPKEEPIAVAPNPAPLRTVPLATSQPAVEPASPPASAELTEEQYDEMVKHQVVQMLFMGATAETIVDYLYDVKPDTCKLINQNPLPFVKAFFTADKILAEATKHPEWNELIEDAKNYIAECEKEEVEAAQQVM